MIWSIHAAVFTLGVSFGLEVLLIVLWLMERAEEKSRKDKT